MLESEVKQRLCAALTLDEIHISAEGSHFRIIAVGDLFAELSPVKCQQLIYKPLTDLITENTIHALTIKTFTKAQWQRERHFYRVSSES